jgi:hypothetical protein
MCARRFMSSAECIDCDAVGRKFPHVSPPMYSPGGHFNRWPPLLIGTPKQIQILVRFAWQLFTNGREMLPVALGHDISRQTAYMPEINSEQTMTRQGEISKGTPTEVRCYRGSAP